MTGDYIVERRLKKEKLRRKARRGEIAIRRLYRFIRFLFILFIFYSLYKFAVSSYWFLPQNVFEETSGNHIEILGNKIVSNEKIITEMKKIPLKREPIYKINPAKTTNQIEQLTPIKRAYVRRYWFPARIIVMIEEVTPAIIISPTEEAREIAAYALTGELIGREYLPLKDNFDTVKVLSYGTKGDDYTKWDIEKINNIYKLAKTIEDYAGEKVLYIDLRVPHNAYVQIESSKIKLGEIDVSVYERIKAIHDILPAVKKMELKTKYIDLSWKDSKYIKEETDSNSI
ncbi:MAG: FtsQ-type POTRA domain-containing protein [Candidatus Gastranaerophilales bacterium]|nr:FtsQ-type POTRA domain-containing protein [Candidatus Gastranaerophilales bacterium]